MSDHYVDTDCPLGCPPEPHNPHARERVSPWVRIWLFAALAFGAAVLVRLA